MAAYIRSRHVSTEHSPILALMSPSCMQCAPATVSVLRHYQLSCMVSCVSERYNRAFLQGRALNEVASEDCKVLVVGNPCNTNALICMENAPRLRRWNFHALMRLDENRARRQLAHRAQRSYTAVTNLCVWGNHSTTQVLLFFPFPCHVSYPSTALCAAVHSVLRRTTMRVSAAGLPWTQGRRIIVACTENVCGTLTGARLSKCLHSGRACFGCRPGGGLV